MKRVDYATLDAAKNAFIAASRKTAGFAKKFGAVLNGFGASANVFSLKAAGQNLFVTLVPEGLGTADDARPDDLAPKELAQFWNNIGVKTVATMTNDAASSGMQPVLISLYLPSSTPEKVFDKAFMKGFLDGFVAACRTVGCVYFSGETPQLATKIIPGRLDIAGSVFGLVPPGQKPIRSSNLNAGDRIVFLASSGPHENGFTTLRHLAEKLPKGYRTKLPSGRQYWEAINAPSVLYSPLIQAVIASGITPTNIEPITGHGWLKLMRPKQKFAYIIEKILPVPEIFPFVQKHSGIPVREMIQIFNYGVGCAVFVRSKTDAARVCRIAARHKIKAIDAGFVKTSKRREVVIRPLNSTLDGKQFSLKK